MTPPLNMALQRWHAYAKEDSMKTTLCLAVALMALSPPARAGSQGAVSGTATSADGVPIRYDAAGKGDSALVFVPCGGCNRGFWDGQMAYFAAKHRVVALDLAGHGQSGVGRKDWTMAAFGQDVVSVVEALGLKRVVLIGHSLGGPAVLEAARRMPSRVAGLVLVDSWVDFEQKFPAEELEKYVSALQADYRATTTAIVSQYLFSASTPEPVKARVLETMLSEPQEIGVAVARSSMAYSPLPALREIKAPIRAISSDRFPTNLEGNRKYVPGYRAAIMKGAGHYLMLEQPEAFNALLAEALRELARSGGRR
jgi:pimeloyl-ACP methyl ester carboxylesterase